MRSRCSRFLRLGICLLAALAAFVVSGATLAADLVAIVLSERGGAYEEVADAVRAELGVTVETAHLQAPDVDGLSRMRPRIAVGIGVQACGQLVATDGSLPLLCVLLPRVAFERISESARTRGRSIAALLLDQPLPRQMALLRLALPERRHVAALLGPESARLGTALSAAASDGGLRLTTARVDDPAELHGALRSVLSETDVLLAVPDGAVFNSGTIQNILRTAFQSRIPLVAFAPAYVRAGALMAVYSTPAQIGRQTGQSLRAFLAGRPLPALQFPRDFQVSVNRNVARALEITLDEEAHLAERLKRLEQPR